MSIDLDLSDWVHRGGNKIVYGPRRNPNGTWLYVPEDENGHQYPKVTGNDGRYYINGPGKSSSDLIPPPPPVEYKFCRTRRGRVLHCLEIDVDQWVDKGQSVYRFEVPVEDQEEIVLTLWKGEE